MLNFYTDVNFCFRMVQAGKRELLTEADLYTRFTPDPLLRKSLFSLVYKKHLTLS